MIFTTTDKFKDLIDYAILNKPKLDPELAKVLADKNIKTSGPLEWAEALSRYNIINCQNGFRLMDIDSSFISGWYIYMWKNCESIIDDDLKNLLINNISNHPRIAAYIFTDGENLTGKHANILQSKFKGKFPTIERELRTLTVRPKLRKPTMIMPKVPLIKPRSV